MQTIMTEIYHPQPINGKASLYGHSYLEKVDQQPLSEQVRLFIDNVLDFNYVEWINDQGQQFRLIFERFLVSTLSGTGKKIKDNPVSEGLTQLSTIEAGLLMGSTYDLQLEEQQQIKIREILTETFMSGLKTEDIIRFYGIDIFFPNISKYIDTLENDDEFNREMNRIKWLSAIKDEIPPDFFGLLTEDQLQSFDYSLTLMLDGNNFSEEKLVKLATDVIKATDFELIIRENSFGDGDTNNKSEYANELKTAIANFDQNFQEFFPAVTEFIQEFAHIEDKE